MIDFQKIGEDSYILYKNGARLNSIPFTKQELYDAIENIELSDNESLFIERFYGEVGKQ